MITDDDNTDDDNTCQPWNLRNRDKWEENL